MNNEEKTQMLSQVSATLHAQLNNFKGTVAQVIPEYDVAVGTKERSDWGSSGGIGYYSQLHIFYGSESTCQEWQWRDRYLAVNDRHDLSLGASQIGDVEVSESERRVKVQVSLINHPAGIVSHTFKKSVDSTGKLLSAEAQEAFKLRVENESQRVLEVLNGLWKAKPKMPCRFASTFTTDGYTEYSSPRLKKVEMLPEFGVAAFVTEEQIDNRGTDPQIRFELYTLVAGETPVVVRCEDHGYESEGGAFLAILGINKDSVEVNSKDGKKVIPFREHGTR